MICSLAIVALIAGAYSHDTLRVDPEVKYTPVSGVGDIANSVCNVTFLAPADYQ